jgi:hypothetical protein
MNLFQRLKGCVPTAINPKGDALDSTFVMTIISCLNERINHGS